jgi:hypothetical protein
MLWRSPSARTRGGRTFEPGPGSILASIGVFLPAQREMSQGEGVNYFQHRERIFLILKGYDPDAGSDARK